MIPGVAATGRWLLVVCFFLSGCSGDWVPFSSGRLEGETVDVPAHWADIAEAQVIQLETNPAEPYSINLWIVAMDDALYVHAGANRTTWVEHIESNPLVRLGSNGRVYELQAERVTSADEFDRFSEIYRDKYGNYPRNRNIDEVYAFRLTSRR